ncbi:MarR family winged helix-turn-helix transcriptional regulator [Nocardioides flavescens]|uniref:MarR family transcriptional regulator n=1 Tax=Nocardioides flavescens TaxID=2691959 RepID=A0A6L7EM35_9ACTN|nr:MarR family winged helix-turn-helix transcriptional regulator [Nocardioides flavescens]MXG88387.1 MarR family transcriptional regulator [Nocardioides flavescens]
MPAATDPSVLGGELATQAARFVRTLRRELDIPASARVLSVLDEHGPSGVTSLASAYGCTQPTMSALVAQLVEQGWTEKSPHPTDTRSTLVSLTPAGHSELARVRRLNGEHVAARLAEHPTLTTAQLRTAVEVLRVLVPAPETQTGSTSS